MSWQSRAEAVLLGPVGQLLYEGLYLFAGGIAKRLWTRFFATIQRSIAASTGPSTGSSACSDAAWGKQLLLPAVFVGRDERGILRRRLILQNEANKHRIIKVLKNQRSPRRLAENCFSQRETPWRS